MKKCLIMMSVFLTITSMGYSAHSATLTVAADNFDTLLNGIISYQVDFDVSGEAVTDVAFSGGQDSIFDTRGGWNQPGSTSLVVLTDNNTFDPTPIIINGDLFTVTYPDTTTLSVSFDSFLDSTFAVIPMFQIPDGTVFGAGDNLLTFSPTAVPIPPTILLLGAGLVGLVGMRRRVKS